VSRVSSSWLWSAGAFFEPPPLASKVKNCWPLLIEERITDATLLL
jgi:hypothetical protein